MDLMLQGKRVVVTGGGAGIGAAISTTLAAEGAVPVILARRAPDPEFMASLGPRAGWVQTDLSDDAQVRAAVAQVHAINTRRRLIAGPSRPGRPAASTGETRRG